MGLLLPLGSSFFVAKPYRFASFQGRNSPIMGGKHLKLDFQLLMLSIIIRLLLCLLCVDPNISEACNFWISYLAVIFVIFVLCQDSANCNGGKWIIRFKKVVSGRFWEDLVRRRLAIASLPPPHTICILQQLSLFRKIN